MTLEQLLDRSPYVLTHCRGRHAFTGVLRWSPALGRAPRRVALTHAGTVLLVDCWATHRRRLAVEAWCAAATASTDWQFCYRPLTPRLVLDLLRGAIA